MLEVKLSKGYEKDSLSLLSQGVLSGSGNSFKLTWLFSLDMCIIRTFLAIIEFRYNVNNYCIFHLKDGVLRFLFY